MKPLLTPSILAANFANLEADIKAAEKGGADYFHLDIMAVSYTHLTLPTTPYV